MTSPPYHSYQFQSLLVFPYHLIVLSCSSLKSNPCSKRAAPPPVHIHTQPGNIHKPAMFSFRHKVLCRSARKPRGTDRIRSTETRPLNKETTHPLGLSAMCLHSLFLLFLRLHIQMMKVMSFGESVGRYLYYTFFSFVFFMMKMVF